MKRKLLLGFGSLISIVAPVTTIVSCNFDKESPERTKWLKAARDVVSTYSIEQLHLDHNKDGVENFAFKGKLPEPQDKASATYWNVVDVGNEDMGASPMEMLPKDIYNSCVAIMDKDNKDATIADAFGISNIKSLIGEKSIVTAIITGDEFHVEFQKMTKDGATAESYLDSSDILEIEKVSTKPFGSWMARVKFFEKNNGNPDWEHGKSSRSNYGITGYPLYMVNMDFAQLGITSQKMHAGQIIHITYNHTA